MTHRHNPITCAVPLQDAVPRRVMPSAWLVRRPGERDEPHVDYGLALSAALQCEATLVPLFEGRPFTPDRLSTLRAGGPGEEAHR